ncbi:MAG: CDP-glucose 4,6-dehydratase [Ferruginibacter sp.]
MEKVVTKEQLTGFYKGKKVLITGHTGFKGSWLSCWLHMLGANIKGYALAPEDDPSLFGSISPFKPGESIIADIRNKEKLKTEIIAFEPDFIFHLAAQPLVRRSYTIPSETFEVNAIGTANLLEAVNFLQKKCTVIIITTDKVYENIEQDVLYKETDRLGGYDPYSASKACTEIVVDSFRNSFFNTNNYPVHQKAIVAARAGNVIGGGDYSPDRILPDIVRALQQDQQIDVRNPGAVRPWQHVLEPLGGYLVLGGLVHNDINYSGAYNFGPEKEDHLTVKELVETAINAWGSGSWNDASDGNAPHEAGLLKLDISKAKTVLNWIPKWNAQTAIAASIEWYKRPASEQREFTRSQVEKYMQE